MTTKTLATRVQIKPAYERELALKGYKFIRIEVYRDDRLIEAMENTLKPVWIAQWIGAEHGRILKEQEGNY